MHVGAEPEFCGELAYMRRRRTFARDHQQHVRHLLAQARQHVQQEVDVLFVRDAPDEQHHRTIRRDPLLFPETGAVAGGEATRRQTRRQHLDRRANAISAQGVGHLPRG